MDAHPSRFSLRGAMYAAERQYALGGEVGREVFGFWNADLEISRNRLEVRLVSLLCHSQLVLNTAYW